MKKFYRPILFVLAVVILVGVIRLIAGEDGWICQEGQWIQHGHPAAEMPTKVCK
jgi:hypothetical protein